MCFRGPTNLKVVRGTLENMLKIKNTVEALLSIQTDQDMKVKYYHKADFHVVEDLGLLRHTRKLQVPQSFNKYDLCSCVHRVDAETREPCN